MANFNSHVRRCVDLFINDDGEESSSPAVNSETTDGLSETTGNNENDNDGSDEEALIDIDDEDDDEDEENRLVNVIDHPRITHPFPDALGGAVARLPSRKTRTTTTTTNDDVDSGGGEANVEDLEADEEALVDVVDVDETSFGRPQYTEADVVPFLSDDRPTETEDRIALRAAILRDGGGSAASSSANAPVLRPRRSVEGAHALRRSKGMLNLLEEDDDEEEEDERVANQQRNKKVKYCELSNKRGKKRKRSTSICSSSTSTSSSSISSSRKTSSQMTQTEANHDAVAHATIAFLKERLKAYEAVDNSEAVAASSHSRPPASSTATPATTGIVSSSVFASPSSSSGLSQSLQTSPSTPLTATARSSSLLSSSSPPSPPRSSSFRCLICVDAYQKPLVSTACWHVHCEECWLRVLGVKKLCPQCNTITSPAHLRKIYV